MHAPDASSKSRSLLWTLCFTFLFACDFRRSPVDTGHSAPADTSDSASKPVDTQDSGKTKDTNTIDTSDTALGPQWDCDQRFWSKGDLDISTETTISGFCDSHNAVDGDLTLIFGTTDDPIMMLDGISCLCEVTGDLELYFYGKNANGAEPDSPITHAFGRLVPHASSDLELQNLRTVGGTFSVHDVPGVTTILGVTSLESVGNDLHLENLSALQDVQFDSLQTVSGNIQALETPKLEGFHFPVLTNASSVTIGGVLGETWHAELKEISAPRIQTLTGDFAVGGAPALETVSVDQLSEVQGAFHIDTTCNYAPSFPALSSVGALRLLGHCSTDELTGLSALQSVTNTLYESSIYIINNDELDTSELDDFVRGLKFPSDAKLVVQGGENGGCDTWMEAKFSRSQTDVCETP